MLDGDFKRLFILSIGLRSCCNENSSFKISNRLSRAFSAQRYYKLCSVVGGSTIYLQKPESVLRPVRDAHIKAEFNGYNHPELARKYGVTERWVRQLCGEGKLEGQMSLLDYGDEPENTAF